MSLSVLDGLIRNQTLAAQRETEYVMDCNKQKQNFYCYVARGDYERAEHHLREAAEIYAVCTPRHDIRGKVELCLAHVYLVPSCRDLSRVRKHLEQVCELAKAIGDNFSDDAHVVLMNAVEHLLQMTGWRASQVQSYVDYAVQVEIPSLSIGVSVPVASFSIHLIIWNIVCELQLKTLTCSVVAFGLGLVFYF